MKIEFHAQGQTLSSGLRSHAESRVRQALGRVARRVRKVRVYFWDANGPRGGEDKSVRMIVELSPSGEVLVKETGTNAFAAVAGAVARIRQAVRGDLRRRWDRRRRASQRSRPGRDATPAATS